MEATLPSPEGRDTRRAECIPAFEPPRSPTSPRGILFFLRRDTWCYFEDYMLSLKAACDMINRPCRFIWWEFDDGSDWNKVSELVRIPGGPHCVFVQRFPPEVLDGWPAEAGGAPRAIGDDDPNRRSDRAKRVPGVLAVLNTEQCTRDWVLQNMVHHVCRGVSLLDYSESNVSMVVSCAAATGEVGIPVRATWLPYQLVGARGHAPPLEGREFDVAQVFAESENRVAVQREMKEAHGLKVLDVRGWCDEREAQIDRAKVLVNVHSGPDYGIFEHLRCDQVIYRKGLVVSEASLGQDTLDIRDRVIFCPYGEIAAKAKEVADDATRYHEACYSGWDPEAWAKERLARMGRALEIMDMWAVGGHSGRIFK